MAARPFHLGPSYAGGGNAPHGDTTFTKIFVGGLAWETQRDTMRLYFEQFGDILEAVVITDKNTGRSKGYGFVTFKDPDSATRACQDPFPVIDGRRANCNLASLGATHRTRPPTPHYGSGRVHPQSSSTMALAAYRGSSAGSVSTAYFHQPTHYSTLPYNLSGYSGGENNMYPIMSCYYGAQQHQFSPYYPANPGVYSSYYPYCSAAHYSQSAQAHSGFALHYQQMLQYPSYMPQQFGPAGSPILSLPAAGAPSASAAPTAAGCVRPAALAPSPASRPPSTASDHNVSTTTTTTAAA